MHVNIRCRRVADSLIPADTGSAFAIKNWPHEVIDVELQDAKRQHTRSQEKFWWGICLPVIAECWKLDKEWGVTPDKGVIHGAFVRAVFGEVVTPLGPERRSSTTLTLEEYSQLIDYAREYVFDKYHTKYGARIPDPNEEA